MSFFKTLEIAASGMSAQRTRMNIASMNMANKNTTRTEDAGPYQRRDVVLAARPIEGNSFSSRMRGIASADRDQYLGVSVEEVIKTDDPPLLFHDPGHPDADANGYVAMPNVNGITEMMNMMGAARAYEAGLNAIRNVKKMAEQATRIGKG